MAFGKLFSQLSSLEKQFKDIDSKIQNFQKQTVAAIDKVEGASKKFINETDQKIDKLDKISKHINNQVKDSKKSK